MSLRYCRGPPLRGIYQFVNLWEAVEIVVLLDREEQPRALYVCGSVRSMHRLEASALTWRIHVHKPSTHVLTSPKLGAGREVARDNILNQISLTSLIKQLSLQ